MVYFFIIFAETFSLNVFKKLISETAIYGLSSMVGRLLFFLLTPLYTSEAVFSTAQYGILNHLYSISAFLLILFGYGLETAFFRFSLKDEQYSKQSYGTALCSISISTLVLGAIILLCSSPIAQWLHATNYQNFLQLVFVVVILDTLTSIPFANLRATNQPITFAGLKIGGIIINIVTNLFFYIVCPYVISKGENHMLYGFVNSIYNPSFGVGYAFLANIAEASFKLLFFLPDYFKYSKRFSVELLQKMLQYGWPITIILFAGMINEVGDRQLLRWLLPGSNEEVESQIGIYGACYKISIFLSLFTQAFRYAGEPFFFAQSNQLNAKNIYAAVLKFFTIIALLGFLSISLNIHIFKHFISNDEYYVGLFIVPILLMAYVFYGIYYNMSIWYKLTDRTKQGSIVAIVGALVTLLINVIFIPTYGFVASAWATFLCFFVMVVLSVFYSNRFYPVPYDWKSIIFYIVIAVLIYLFGQQLANQFIENSVSQIAVQFFSILLFLGFVWYREKKSITQFLKSTG